MKSSRLRLRLVIGSMLSCYSSYGIQQVSYVKRLVLPSSTRRLLQLCGCAVNSTINTTVDITASFPYALACVTINFHHSIGQCLCHVFY